MNNTPPLPFFIKASIFFIGLFTFLIMVYIAQAIIIPLVFAAFFAVMLNPIVNLFNCKMRIPRVIAILVTLVLSFLVMVALGLFLYSQIMKFAEGWPKLGERSDELIAQSLFWITDTFDISKESIAAAIARVRSTIMNSSISGVTSTLTAISSVVAFVVLLPVYVFLVLYYKPLFINFALKAAGVNYRDHASGIILGTRTIIQSYLNGLVIEGVIVAVLNSAGLLFLGIQYAILLGVMGAMLNVIPYIGGVIAVGVTMLIALITKSPVYSIYVLLLYLGVQFIDNQIIFPRVVGSKVQINALVSIVAVIAGGFYWGIAGMFLSLPIIAVLKIIFDRIDILKPYGEVLGNIIPKSRLYLTRPKKMVNKVKSREPEVKQ